MRILWVSNAPWANTGYGNQTRLFTPRLQAAGYPTAVHAFYGLEGGVLQWGPIQVYPRFLEPYGNDIVAAHTGHWQADIVISLLDSWVCKPDMYGQNVRWCPWFPIDHEGQMPSRIREVVARSYQPLVYSRFGEKVAKDAGLSVTYVPHGVDTKAYAPMDRAEARRKMGWTEDRFVVAGVMANKGNPSRKAFPAQLEAFSRFKREHPDALLYLHSCMSEHGEHGGVNLPELCGHLGLRPGADVQFCDQYQNIIGFNDGYLRLVYNAADVLLSVTMGEGFGIPILEAQACGCPVIVGGWTAMPELLFAGWQVSREEAEPYWTPLAAYQFMPHVDAIVDRLEQAYAARGNEILRRQARSGAMAYDADKVTNDYWIPALREIESKIKLSQQLTEQVRADWKARA